MTLNVGLRLFRRLSYTVIKLLSVKDSPTKMETLSVRNLQQQEVKNKRQRIPTSGGMRRPWQAPAKVSSLTILISMRKEMNSARGKVNITASKLKELIKLK